LYKKEIFKTEKMGENRNCEHYSIPSFLNSGPKIIIVTAIFYYILAQLSLLVIVPEINIPPFFPAIGFAVAFVLVFGRKALIGVAIGSFTYSIGLYISDFDHGTAIGEYSFPLVVCFIRPLIACLNPIIVSYLIQLWCKNKYPFSKGTDVFYFTLAAAIGTITSLALGLLPLAFTSFITIDKIILTWSNWSRSSLLGIILITPLTLSLLYKTKESFKWTLSKKIESILLIIGTIAITLYVFTTKGNNESIIFFVLIFAASRFGIKIITSVILIVTIIAVKCTLHHMGGFGWNSDFLMLQLFLFVNIASVLYLKAILKEKESKEDELIISEQDLGLEKNILKATIESPIGISISSLDTNLNYLSFNAAHASYMKNEYGADIKIGDSHVEIISKGNRKEEIIAIFQDVLKGNLYTVEEKDVTGEYWSIGKSPIKDERDNIIGVTTIVTNITELKSKEIQLEKNNNTLNERIKELGCLFEVSRIISNKKLSKPEKMEACAQIIPMAMQFPEMANCRIQLYGEEFISANYQQNDCFVKQTIIINGEESGFIEIGYFNAIELLSDIISRSMERKFAEEKLLNSEEKFRSIYENSLDIYFRKDLEGIILEIGPSVEKHLHRKQEFMIGKNIKDFYYDSTDGDRFYKIILKEQQIYDFEEVFITPTAELVYFSVNAKLVYDSDGNPLFVEGTKRNISERIHNEKQLLVITKKIKESEEKFRSIYESLDDIYFKRDLGGHLLEVSPSVEKHFNIKRESVIGENAYDFFVNRIEGDRFNEAILQNKEVSDYEERFITGTGEIVYFSINAKVIYDSEGEPAYFEGTMRNVNERIQNRKKLQEATEKIKESEEKFRSIYENMQDVYYLHNIDGTLLDTSPSAEKYFNAKREELIGEKVQKLFTNPLRYDELTEITLREGFINDKEVQFITTTGEEMYFSVNSKLINDSNGNTTLVEGTMRNISERIINQKQLLEASEKIKISEEKFRSIFENMQDIYYMHELDGKLLDISPSVEKQLKYKREEMIGRNTMDFHYDLSLQPEIRAKIIRDGYITDEHIQFVTATGEPLYFSVNCKIIYDQNGVPTHVEGSMRNINDRIINQNKLLEATEKIKQSEEEFRTIFESYEDIYFRSSLDGYFQNASPSVEKTLKYKREEVIGSPVNNYYLYPEDRIQAVETLRNKGYINDFETIFKDKDNNPVHLSVNAHLVYDSNGDPLCIEGTIRDITERKNNELKIEIANQAIKESEKKYRTIFESVQDVFFRASAKDHKIIDVSPSCSNFGIEPQEMIGKPIGEFYLNPEDRIPVLNELQQKGEINNYDIKLLLNSKTFTVSINSKIAYDQNNEPEFIIGSFRDVSDRVLAEENLKISEAKFRSIYENFEDVYFYTTLEGTILDLSPSFEQHLLKPTIEAVGTSVLDFYYEPHERTLLLEELKKCGHVSDFDVRLKAADGNVIYFSVNIRFVYDANGIPTNIEGTMRNINDRVSFQKEMLAKNRKLEFQNTELEQFAYIASHDLQEPLITVIQCIQFLQEELHENLDEEQKKYMEFISSSTSRMQLLVKGLLDYSRIGKERKTKSIDCNEIMSNVLADMDVSLKDSNAKIEYGKLPTIEGNATEMRQLFQNVISNAIKFRKKDSPPKIKIAAIKEAKHWLFSIEDNGIGIKAADMDKVFVIFKRLNNRSEYQGTGIGLSHCKKIIEQHKGKIWVESKFNEGSTFKWTFPIEQN
jgi:PAS domain S-box-containing protein